jgi:DNA-binding CsgD family transcriptional regulator
MLFMESLALVLYDAGVPASAVDRAEAVRGLHDVAALLVCDDAGAQLLPDVLTALPASPQERVIVALDGAPVPRADVRLGLTAGRDDLLRALAPRGAGTAGLPERPGRVPTRRALPDLDGTRQLTTRESEVVALLVRGTPSPQIAVELGISANTVRTHVQNIMAKLGVHSRLEAASIVAGDRWQAVVPVGARAS